MKRILSFIFIVFLLLCSINTVIYGNTEGSNDVFVYEYKYKNSYEDVKKIMAEYNRLLQKGIDNDQKELLERDSGFQDEIDDMNKIYEEQFKNENYIYIEDWHTIYSDGLIKIGEYNENSIIFYTDILNENYENENYIFSSIRLQEAIYNLSMNNRKVYNFLIELQEKEILYPPSQLIMCTDPNTISANFHKLVVPDILKYSILRPYTPAMLEASSYRYSNYYYFGNGHIYFNTIYPFILIIDLVLIYSSFIYFIYYIVHSISLKIKKLKINKKQTVLLWCFIFYFVVICVILGGFQTLFGRLMLLIF